MSIIMYQSYKNEPPKAIFPKLGWASTSTKRQRHTLCASDALFLHQSIVWRHKTENCNLWKCNWTCNYVISAPEEGYTGVLERVFHSAYTALPPVSWFLPKGWFSQLRQNALKRCIFARQHECCLFYYKELLLISTPGGMQLCRLSSSGLLPFRFHICGGSNSGEKIQLRIGGLERHTTLRTAGLFILFVCLGGRGEHAQTCAQDYGGQKSRVSIFFNRSIYLLSQCLSLDLLWPAA